MKNKNVNNLEHVFISNQTDYFDYIPYIAMLMYNIMEWAQFLGIHLTWNRYHMEMHL